MIYVIGAIAMIFMLVAFFLKDRWTRVICFILSAGGWGLFGGYCYTQRDVDPTVTVLFTALYIFGFVLALVSLLLVFSIHADGESKKEETVADELDDDDADEGLADEMADLHEQTHSRYSRGSIVSRAHRNAAARSRVRAEKGIK